MKIALISDILTEDSLKAERGIELKIITSFNYKFILKFWKPDFLFVESAWQGYKNKWKFKIANYKDYPKRNNEKLQNVINYAKELDIPTAFWNKEDGVHFNRFIDSALLFDHIFTVDSNCIPKYKSLANKNTTINTLEFAVQEQFHNFKYFNFKYKEANFVGSYSKHIHDKRRYWQDLFLSSCKDNKLDVSIFDRNSNRKNTDYRFPDFENISCHPAVKYKDTANIYKDYMLSLNVNTIEDSPTMFSRRLVEILACGGLCVTNNSLAVETSFKEFCFVINNEEEANELFRRVKLDGLSNKDLEMARAGSELIHNNFTWTKRLEQISDIILK
ncbi:glycosyltransferase [bacterium]|nr:glycosyltransferase [bacterium]